jgi:3-phenylpropionate/cinnamic acid dioxygenase small subunit
VTNSTVIELMTAFSRTSVPTGKTKVESTVDLMRRKPKRVTVTVNWHTYQMLQERSDYEGRSLSNLVSHICEVAVTN